MKLDDLTFERAVLEIKYPTALLLWDRSGALWLEAIDRWPDLKLISAQPVQTVFKIGAGFELVVELTQIRIIGYFPERSLKQFTDVAKGLLELVVKHLEIRVYSRVGLRLLLFRKFPDRKESSAAVLGTNLIQLPERRHFGAEGAPISVDLALRWESSATGVMAHLAQQDREYTLEPPAGTDFIKAEVFKSHGILLDVDFFTVSSMEAGKLGVEDWIGQNLHAFRRDADSFLGG